ncbi:MAG: PIN domain nuclease [Thermoplasmata archaeon]|nr:MAG: PIN domain nuclease [Thermoplasmata archaeon]
MNVLVDSSVWIDYFRGVGQADILDYLIDENLVITNNLILTELVPTLYVLRQKKLISMLKEIKRYPVNIDWDNIMEIQITCIRNGINGIGITDLIIAQNAIQHKSQLLSVDGHFVSISKHLPLSLFEQQKPQL